MQRPKGQKYKFVCAITAEKQKKQHNEVVSPTEKNIIICLKEKNKAFQNPPRRSECGHQNI